MLDVRFLKGKYDEGDEEGEGEFVGTQCYSCALLVFGRFGEKAKTDFDELRFHLHAVLDSIREELQETVKAQILGMVDPLLGYTTGDDQEWEIAQEGVSKADEDVKMEDAKGLDTRQEESSAELPEEMSKQGKNFALHQLYDVLGEHYCFSIVYTAADTYHAHLPDMLALISLPEHLALSYRLEKMYASVIKLIRQDWTEKLKVEMRGDRSGFVISYWA